MKAETEIGAEVELLDAIQEKPNAYIDEAHAVM